MKAISTMFSSGDSGINGVFRNVPIRNRREPRKREHRLLVGKKTALESLYCEPRDPDSGNGQVIVEQVWGRDQAADNQRCRFEAVGTIADPQPHQHKRRRDRRDGLDCVCGSQRQAPQTRAREHTLLVVVGY